MSMADKAGWQVGSFPCAISWGGPLQRDVFFLRGRGRGKRVPAGSYQRSGALSRHAAVALGKGPRWYLDVAVVLLL